MENDLQRKTAEKIRSAYAPKDVQESKLDQLKGLDRKVRRPAAIFAWAFGAVGALVLGVGMCLAMEVIGSLMPLGIAVGVVGIAMVVSNWFIYKAILKSRRARYAERIVSLSDELLHTV